ncbi:MAG: hypothetical protein MZU95_16815 [Desulfomicrobium escambiense]|nr:hypothetical protein [Desulfomicrobium escambiense]
MVPRIYTNKPRTTGKGYKGMLHQPNHRDKPDMARGLQAIREMHIRALELSRLPAADEMLYPGNYPYLADILSYVAVGARSVENQEHRLTISGLDVPAGMKNPTSGDLRVMIDSIYAAQQPHVFVYNGWAVATSGNPLTHGVVRGSVDRYGNHFANYHYEDLVVLAEMYLDRSLTNPSIIVDTQPLELREEVPGSAAYRHGGDEVPAIFRASEEDGERVHDRKLPRGGGAGPVRGRIRQIDHRSLPGVGVTRKSW